MKRVPKSWCRWVVAWCCVLMLPACAAPPAWQARSAASVPVRTVHFPSADGRTTLVGYLFVPAGPGPFPAVVMLHGRAGAYSARVSAGCSWVGEGHDSPCNAATQSARARAWGEFWAAQGVMALHVDSFGPRGVAHGFGRFTHEAPEREAVNERSVRPLDAAGALAWLRHRADVRPQAVALQGWSNGASTVLNTVAAQGGVPGFAFALAFYPGCGTNAVTRRPYAASTRLDVFLGSDDEEVSPVTCRELLDGAAAGAGQVQVHWNEGATHDFDDPGSARQSVAANRRAREDAFARVRALAERRFAPSADR